jgi:hypothetical protein
MSPRRPGAGAPRANEIIVDDVWSMPKRYGLRAEC